MEVDSAFLCGRDVGMNGRFSFKSLLLGDEDLFDEPRPQFLVSGDAGAQLILAPDLGVVGDTLQRNGAVHPRESLQSFLLNDRVDGSSSQTLTQENGNPVQYCDLSPSFTPAALGPCIEEESSRFVVESPVAGQCDEEVEFPDFRYHLRRKGRVTRFKAAGRQTSSPNGPPDSQGLTMDNVQQQPQNLSALPILQKKRQAGFSNGSSVPKRRKQGASSVDIQNFVDSLVARQEAFFTDLLEHMERKEAIRERIREEKEERWRAEERFQCEVFNQAMLTLTKALLSDSPTTKLPSDKTKKS